MFRNMKMQVALFILFAMFFLFTACAGDDVKTTTQAETTTARVNNIYITPEGVVADYFSEPTQLSPTLTQPVTTAPVVPENSQNIPSTEIGVTAIEAQTTIPVVENIDNTLSAGQVLAIIKDSVNDMKQQTDFDAHLLQQVTINLTDCTFSWAVPIINAAIGVFNGPHNFDYSFVNGTSLDPKEDMKTSVTPYDAIPPSSRLFSLDPEGVVSYESYEENGEYVYTVTLLNEYTNAQVAVPYHHANALDYLDLADFDFGIGEITDSQCNYPGATITVRKNAEGKLIKYEQTIPMNGSGTGKLGISLSASFEGNMYECWTFN